jgi:hypothetical protein
MGIFQIKRNRGKPALDGYRRTGILRIIPPTESQYDKACMLWRPLMRGILWFLVLFLIACTAFGCAAPVKIAPFPGPNVATVSPEVCANNYDAVQVMGSFPTNRKY